MFAEIVFSQMAQMTQIFSLRTLSASYNNLRDQRNLRETVNTRGNMCSSQIAQMTQIFTLHTLLASEINLRNLRNLREINNTHGDM